MTKDKRNKKLCTKLKIAAIVLTAIAAAMLIVAFLMPPPWEIHQSVLAAVGELFAFAALFFAWESVDRGIDAKLTHGNTTIELNNPNEDAE